MLLKRFLLSLLMIFPATAALAVETDWVEKPQVSVRLLSAVETVGDAETVPLGIEFKLKPGWKIYWRSPGDAGLPPQIKWDGSGNVKDAGFRWPAPERFSVLGLETLGYKKQVVLPVDVALAQPGSAADIKLALNYLVCEEVCIPYNSDFTLAIPAGPEKPSAHANTLAQYRAQVPMRDSRHGVTYEGGAFKKIEKGIQVTLAFAAAEPFAAPDVFLEGPLGSYFEKPKATLSDDKKAVRLDFKAGGAKADSFAKEGLVATFVDGDRALETDVPVTFGATLPETAAMSVGKPVDGDSFIVILLFAVLGGLILNVMPCVLPVLSIKLLGVIGKSGKDRAVIRAGFLASAAGIVFSFLLIAGFLIAFKSAGMAIGWGIQFQQPVFLAFLSVVLALFAYNLFGLFEIAMPAWVGNIVASSGPEKNLGGHFLTGALATLVATPCSAPFLGTAVGFALSRSWFEIVAVFIALGIGLAVPYLLIAAFPGFAQKMPKPGAWMNWVRRFMGLALAATVVWLLYVIATLIGNDGAFVLAALLLAVGALLWLRRIPDSRLGRHATAVVAVVAVAAIVFPATWERSTAHTEDPAFKQAWLPFDQAEIKRQVAAGNTVLVDVTADWCVTCQVNKRLVLQAGKVGGHIVEGKIVAMRADWTRPSDEIAAYLASFGRYGIPFNAVYGSKAPNGIALPELLTQGLVLDAVDQASGTAVAADK